MTWVILEDVSLRDGLQFEQKFLPLEEKLILFHLLVNAGLKRLQVGSFVHPELIPQTADTDEFVRVVKDEYPDILVSALVLNGKGLERARDCHMSHLTMSVSASDSHSRRNVNRPSLEALTDMIELVKSAVDSGIQVRVGIQCAFGCVYEGAISEDKIVEIASRLAESGAVELNLADTTGMGHPMQVKRLVKRVIHAVPGRSISLHLHDTRGLGIANMMAGYEAGVEIFDVSAGGLGGCPFVVGASGNVPTEDAVNLFYQSGIHTGIDIDDLCKVVDRYEELFGRRLPGRMNHVIKAQKGVCP